MGSMKDLLGDTPYSARYPNAPGYTEPTTSKAAAVAMKSRANTLRDQVLALLATKPVTVHEAADILNVTVPAVQPRFSELRAAGKIEATGERRKNSSGMSASVWRAKP